MNHLRNLKELRLSKGLSQQSMADELQITQQAYANYEAGKRTPDLQNLVRLANFFDTSIDYILGNTDDPTPPDKKKPTPETVGPVLTSVLKEAGYLKDGKPLTDKEASRLLNYLIAIHEADLKENE